MARGFESKSVIDQQEAEESRLDAREAPTAEPARVRRRRTLELGRTALLRQLEQAQAKPHQVTLRRALAAIDAELDRL